HERMDGSGYPSGLTGEAILFGSRIVAVADVVESMTSHRPYRPALGVEAALTEIRTHRGTKFDASVVDAFLAMFQEGPVAL
ncbi:MAG TPA: HD domain-containing phosphohydrolase, partial [Steroidobacteraceae bacterium]